MEEKKQAENLVVKKLSEMTPEEQEAIRKSFREKLRKYYENRPPIDVIRALMGDSIETE